jgi:hypothetical protein
VAASTSFGSSEARSVCALVLIVLAIAPRTYRIWTGERPTEKHVPSWWVWGQPLWRAIVRTHALLFSMTALLAVAASALMLSDVTPGAPASTLVVVGVGGATLWLLTLAFALSVLLFNRSDALIAPRFRGESGLVRRRPRRS